MNGNSVTASEPVAAPAPLRLAGSARPATGSKESEALVELFLTGGHRGHGGQSGEGGQAEVVGPVAVVAPVKRAQPVAPARPALFFGEPVDALDMLIDGHAAGEDELDGRDSGPVATPLPGVQAGVDAGAARPAVLAEYLAGLRGIDARCPYAPGVELATDEAGALHLIAWRGEGDAGAAGGAGAIADLQIASKWAWEHMGLLAKIAPLDARSRPAVQHLVTARSEGLRGLLTTSLRVHLAIAVNGDGGRRWVCAALNES